MFILEYIKNPKFIGAITPSSKYLAEAMITDIDFKNVKCIVEYGPGTVVFTEKILSRVKEDTIVILIEINKNFYNTSKGKYGCERNIIIKNDSAENIYKILEENHIYEVNYILSGIPFTSLPKNISENIFKKTVKVINNKASFITFQYSLLKLPFLKKYFKNIKYKSILRNIPSAYVIECKFN